MTLKSWSLHPEGGFSGYHERCRTIIAAQRDFQTLTNFCGSRRPRDGRAMERRLKGPSAPTVSLSLSVTVIADIGGANCAYWCDEKGSTDRSGKRTSPFSFSRGRGRSE